MACCCSSSLVAAAVAARTTLQAVGPAGRRSAAFGIDTRPNVAAFDLPTSAGNPGIIDLVAAFPNLSFNAAIFLSGVPGDTRLVVAQQSGQVRAFVPSVGVGTSRLILDVSGKLVFGGEQGLLGLAFDPNFATNRFIYVHYSRRADGATIIARYTWDAGTDIAVARQREDHPGRLAASVESQRRDARVWS